MNGIVNTAMKGHKAPQHLRIGSIDDGIHLEAGDIALPFDESIVSFFSNLNHAFLRQLRLQLIVLQP